MNLKIAVTYENGEVFQHFGRTEAFKVYEIEDNAVKSAAVLGTNGSGHGALADVLKNYDVDALLCGGIGGGARQAIAAAGISLYGGVVGNADAAIAALLDGELVYSDAACTEHGEHGHSHGHNCGDHGCAEDCAEDCSEECEHAH